MIIFEIKMKNRFVKNKPLLFVLSNCKNKLRKAIIENSGKEEIYSICECVLNVCNGNVKLIKEDHKKLKKYRKIFKKLLDKGYSLSEKKKLLVQKGGFLQFLIPAIVTGLSSIISSAISKT